MITLNFGDNYNLINNLSIDKIGSFVLYLKSLKYFYYQFFLIFNF